MQYKVSKFIFTFGSFFIRFNLGLAGLIEEKLLHKTLFEDYNKHVVPRINDSKPINVSIFCSVGEILNLDATENSLSWNLFFHIIWRDDLLTWNSSQYNGTEKLYVPVDQIWLPDVVVVNGMGESKALPKQTTTVSVQSNGHVTWMPYGQMKTICDVDITNFPFDSHTCTVKIEHWIYDRYTQLFNEPAIQFSSIAFYQENSQWSVKDVRSYFSLPNYVGPHPISQFLFTITLQRRTRYYILNLISPVVLMSCLNLFCFLIPPECGEKMTLSVSIFLTFAVYMTVINGEMPKSSTHILLFGTFLFGQLVLSGMTIILEAIVLHVYFKAEKTTETEKQFCTVERQTDKSNGYVIGTARSERSSKQTHTEITSYTELPIKLDRMFCIIMTCLNVISIAAFCSLSFD